MGDIVSRGPEKNFDSEVLDSISKSEEFANNISYYPISLKETFASDEWMLELKNRIYVVSYAPADSIVEKVKMMLSITTDKPSRKIKV